MDKVLTFTETLPYVWKGMAGIFIVTLILIAVILILDRCTRK